MVLRIQIAFLLLLITTCSIAQDVQLSQYYNQPLYLNPAFAGTASNARGILNYRSQWTTLPSPFVTMVASFDHFIGPYNSGVGLLIKRDRQGDAGLVSTDINAIYSYQVFVGQTMTFVPSLQVGFVNRSLNYNNLVFGDQLTNDGVTNLPTIDNINNQPNLNYLDFAGGGLLFSDKFWIGFASHHINRPNQSFDGSNKLAMKTSIHGGYKFNLDPPKTAAQAKYASHEKSIIPTFNYKTQAEYDQLDLGLYMIYEPVMFGLWYRGIPVKRYAPGFNNHDAFVFLVGAHYNGLSVGYSYDLTISSLKPGSGGSHEISLTYEWEIPYKNYKPKKRARKVSCPKF